MTLNFTKKIIRVAHIDDDEGYLSIVAQLLDKLSPMQYKITSMTSSREAFFQINSNPDFDIIISDYEMPNLNGLDLYENIHETGIRIPFILLTGTSDEDVPLRALNVGFKFFLRKEHDIMAIVKQLDQLIKITIAQVNAEKEIIENEIMLSDFIYLITNNMGRVDKEVYSQDLFKSILKSFIDISKSDYAFLNEVNYVIGNTPSLSKNFFSWVDWNEESGYKFELVPNENFLFKQLEPFYASVLLDKIPVIENDLESNKTILKSESHTKRIVLKSVLILPIFFEPTRKLVGIIGLINRLNGYDDKIIFKLHPFCLNLANYLYLKIYMANLNKNNFPIVLD